MSWVDYHKILLSMVLWREARGEGEDGMTAVACVIRNRVKLWKISWIVAIVAKNQFSSMGTAGDSQLVLWPQDKDLKFEAAMRIAEQVYNDYQEDITGGAVYYANLATATSGWFFENIVNQQDKHPQTVTVGHHTFFK